MSTIEKLVITVIVIFVIMLVVLPFTGIPIQYSEGDRAGTITKFSKKGVLFKTWEGELLIGGMRQSTTGAVANVWQFSVPKNDEGLISQIQALQQSGERAKLTYLQRIKVPFHQGSTNYLIQNAELAK